jgi:hypothetical protein
VNFSELKEEEKEKYIDFILQNNIDIQEDESNNEYVACIKVKKTSKLPERKTLTNKENIPTNKKRPTSKTPNSPRSRIENNNLQVKSESFNSAKQEAFALASNLNFF